RSVAVPKAITWPFESASDGGSPRGVGTSGDVAIVTVVHQTYELDRLRNVQRLLQKLPGRPVGRDHDQKSVDPLPDDSTVRHGHQGRRVDDDVVVVLSSLHEELPDPGRFQYLVGSGWTAAGRDDRQVEVRALLRHGLQRQIRVQDR